MFRWLDEIIKSQIFFILLQANGNNISLRCKSARAELCFVDCMAHAAINQQCVYLSGVVWRLVGVDTLLR